MIEGIWKLLTPMAPLSNRTMPDAVRNIFRSEQLLFSKISQVRTLQYLAVHYMIYLHNRTSQLASNLCKWNLMVFATSLCLIGVHWVMTCCICWICRTSDISYYGLEGVGVGRGGWVGGGGWDKLRSYYRTILTFDNYGRPLSIRPHKHRWLLWKGWVLGEITKVKVLPSGAVRSVYFLIRFELLCFIR